MDVGFMIRFMDGPGCPVINGVVVGWYGVTAMDIMVGGQLVRVFLSISRIQMVTICRIRIGGSSITSIWDEKI